MHGHIDASLVLSAQVTHRRAPYVSVLKLGENRSLPRDRTPESRGHSENQDRRVVIFDLPISKVKKLWSRI